MSAANFGRERKKKETKRKEMEKIGEEKRLFTLLRSERKP